MQIRAGKAPFANPALLLQEFFRHSIDKPHKTIYNRQGKTEYADMAQEVEHILGKDEVTSSNLVISSTKKGFRLEALFSWSWGEEKNIIVGESGRRY